MIDHGVGTYTNRKGLQRQVSFLVLEQVDGASLETYIRCGLRKYDENQVLFLFYQLMMQVYSCHN